MPCKNDILQVLMRCCIAFCIMLIALVSLPGITPAQPYYFRHYQVEDGLSNNTVLCGRQDKTGFLWFGTKDGLNRFDGYRFRRFNPQNPVSQHPITYNPITGLFVDQDGSMYVGADGGLYLYHANEERLSVLIDSIRFVHNILADTRHNLWFIADGAICHFNTVTKKMQRLPHPNHAYITSLDLDAEGNLWCATATGFVEKYNESTGSFIAYNVFSHSKPVATGLLQKILIGGNKMYIGSYEQGIKEFDLPSKTYKDLLIYNEDKTNVIVRDILQVSMNEYWFATESGIFIWKTNTQTFTHLKKRFLDPYSLSDNALYALCKDREGGVWAGSYFGGVNYWSAANTFFQKFFPDNTFTSISGRAVREICEDKNGNIWIGTEDAGISKINPQTGAIRQFEPDGTKNTISYRNIHGLFIDDSLLWIGTFEHGIDVMDIRTEKVIKHFSAGPKATDIKSNFIYCFLRHSRNDLYMGTTNGVYLFSPRSETFQRPPELAGAHNVRSVIEDHNGVIWAAAFGQGVFWFNTLTHKSGQVQSMASNTNSLSDNNVNALFEDSAGNLWFATEGGGLCKLDTNRKKFTRYSIRDGLPSDFIFKVIEDNNHYIWITTSKGLVNMNPSTGEMNVYTKANGLLTDQFNYHSGYKDKNGKLYFGSVNGLIAFQPKRMPSDSSQLHVYITSIQVQNKEIPVDPQNGILKKSPIVTDKITLPYFQTSVSFDFSALSYVAPGTVQYAYMLEGLDKEWTYLNTNRKVYFTNLSPGTYIFRVKATHNHLWNTPETKMVIHINSPLWATPYAYAFYFLILGLLSWYLIITYHNRQKVKREKEMYESKMAFFTNVAHEIRTPLTLIKGPLENMLDRLPQIEDEETREDLVTMDRNTTRLTELVTQILDFRQTEQKGFSLEFSTVNLSRLLQEMFTNFKPLVKKKHLSYTLSVPENTIEIQADEDALRKIISNLLSNAIKYADKIVKLRLFRDDVPAGKLILEIENDGYPIPAEIREKIFEPFYRVKETARQKGTGIGLTLARSLTELHGGRLYLKDHKGSTNIFVLEIPLHSSKRNRTE